MIFKIYIMRKYHKTSKMTKIPSLTYKMATIPLKKSLKGLKYHQSIEKHSFCTSTTERKNGA